MESTAPFRAEKKSSRGSHLLSRKEKEWSWAQISSFPSSTCTLSQESPEDGFTYSRLRQATKAAAVQIKRDGLHHEVSISVVQKDGQKGFMLFEG